MGKVKNIFVEGKMNKDLDERLIPEGQYVDALNARINNSTGSDVGAIENSLSNKKLSNIDFGNNPMCIGACTNPADQMVYWFVVSDDGCYIAEYSDFDNHTALILKDTRPGTTNVLQFKPGNPIDCNILIDDDNEKIYIYFTDGITPPKKIEVEHAKTLPNSQFTFDDISVIVKPPIFPPKITPKTTENDLERKNNMKEKFLMFGYRYKYKDNQYSAVSPFSPVAFLPENYKFNFEDHVLECMVNIYDNVDITFNTGDVNVKEIDLVFKETSENLIYLAKSFNKADEDFDDNEEQTYNFSNNQIYKVLPEKEIFRLYDNVPLTAKTQEIINNRLVYGNYTENYDLKDEAGNEVIPDIDLKYSQNVTDLNVAVQSVKSNRDYEIGIVYLDEHGRSTTVLSGGDNSTYVKPYASITQNELYAIVKHKAPKWAKYYRFFIKETVNDFNNVCSSTFHVGDDENDIYVKLGGDDINKIKEGDFITMKRGTDGALRIPEEFMIRDVEKKERNFLDYNEDATDTEQEPGLYMSLKQRSSFLIQADSFTEYNYDQRVYAKWNVDPLTTPYHNVTTGPYFYGFDPDSDDLNLVSTTYPGSGEKNDIFRIEVEISTKDPSADKFRYRVKSRGKYAEDDVNDEWDGTWTNWSDEITCSTSNTDIDIAQDGTGVQQKVVVNFTSATGHNIGDKWTMTYKPQYSWKANSNIDGGKRAYTNVTFETGDAGKVYKGSFATISTFEIENKRNEKSTETELTYADEDYETFEEFYWEERIYEQIASQGLPEYYISFHRGVQTTGQTNPQYKTLTTNTSDNEIMVYESWNSRPHRGQAAPAATLTIEFNQTEGQNSTFLAETKPDPQNTDVYYEIGKTYEVSNFGYHQGDAEVGDTSQNHDTNARIKLDFFNCFAWGNSHESIKIKDSFFGKKYNFRTRPLTSIEKYQENERRASLTYSNVYDQTTNYNGLNEFNLSTANYKDLDDADGDIQRIISRDTDLVCFQENKISKVLYNKNVLFSAGGDGSLSQTTEVLGQQIPYLGEYGVTTSPHSIATWAGRIYLADPRRGAVLRVSQDGITEISQYGMRDWFRDNMKPMKESNILGGYDPENGQYVLSIQTPLIEWREESVECENFEWRVDVVECMADLDCDDVSFTMADGITGASTADQGTVSAGTITDISPATYQEGSTTYTATIKVPYGYANEQESITCTATATGAATTTTTTTTLATFTCTDANFSIANGASGASTSGQGSVSAGTITAISPTTYSTGSGTYTATITVPSGYANSGQSISCTATASGTTSTTLATFSCSDAGFNIANAQTASSSIAYSTVSEGTITSVSPSTIQSGSNTYTATITVPAGYTNSGSSITCTDTATGTDTLPTFSCSDANFVMSAGTEDESTSGQGSVTNGTITSISPSTYTGGSATYTATITAPAGFNNAGSSITCTDTVTSAYTTTLATFDCNDANFSMASGATGASTSGQGSVDEGTITSISPSTYVNGSATYTATITVPANYTNSGNSITCTASASGTTTLATFTCTDANFTMANGSAGASTSGQGSVSAGTITSISPSTYTTGSGTYTATITVPSGYSNAGQSITCTATASGTTTTPAVQCFFYDVVSDGGDTVQFFYDRCNTGNTLSVTVPNGDSATVCAREGSVYGVPNSGTIIKGSSCG